MKYTVICSNGKVMCFYVKAVAETYASAYKGVLVENSLLEQELVEA